MSDYQPVRLVMALPWASSAPAPPSLASGARVDIKLAPFGSGGAGASASRMVAALFARPSQQPALTSDGAGEWVGRPGAAYEIVVTLRESASPSRGAPSREPPRAILKHMTKRHFHSSRCPLTRTFRKTTVTRRPHKTGQMRVVRASLGGHEINEQLLLPRGGGSARFVGWLESADGTKRLQFLCPPTPGETVCIQVPPISARALPAHLARAFALCSQVAVFEATSLGGGGKGKGEGGAGRPPGATAGDAFAGPAVSSERFELGQPVAIGQVRLRSEPAA